MCRALISQKLYELRVRGLNPSGLAAIERCRQGKALSKCDHKWCIYFDIDTVKGGSSCARLQPQKAPGSVTHCVSRAGRQVANPSSTQCSRAPRPLCPRPRSAWHGCSAVYRVGRDPLCSGMRWPSPGLTSLPAAPIASTGSVVRGSLHMRPAAKALLSAARHAAAAKAPRAARQSCTISGGDGTGTLVAGQARTAFAPAWERCRPAFGLLLDGGLLLPRRSYSNLCSHPRGRHQLAACQPAHVAVCNASRCSNRPLPETSKAPISARNNSRHAFGGQPSSVSGLRWAASGPAPGCSTAARALAEEVATRDAEAPGQNAEHDQAPVGAAASQVSECGEHTGETDDDEEAAKVDLIPWPPGGQCTWHEVCVHKVCVHECYAPYQDQHAIVQTIHEQAEHR